MKKILLGFLALSSLIFSQAYKTIETENVRVVFEEGLEDEAKETGNYIESLKAYYGDKFEGDLKSIPVILRKGNNLSNAHFTAMPKKLDYVTVAPISDKTGVTPWLLDLSIHEYRHFMQYQLIGKSKSGKILNIFGGNTYVFGYGMLVVPNWVWEGEAVSFETKLSDNGRGRTPSFLEKYRALFEADKTFSYEKAKNSSYKDDVPSIYHLGYLIVSYGYEKYGEKFWEDMFLDAPDTSGFVPFSKNLKTKTGMSSTEFYKEALNYFKEKYRVEKSIEYENVLEKDKSPTNYYCAYPFNDELITLKKGYDERSAFYKINGQSQEKIINTGYMGMDEYFEVKNNKILWTEIEPDLLKSHINYSVIKTYDLEKNEKKTLSKKSYYYSPSMSEKGEKISVIENNGYEPSSIDILDENGKFIKKLENSKGYFYSYTKWLDEINIIVVLRDKTGKMGMKLINTENEEEKNLLEFDNVIISAPFVNNNEIYFSASFDLVKNVYKIDLENNILKKVTESNIGAHNPSVIGGKLYFSEYTWEGYKLRSTEMVEGFVSAKTNLLEDEQLNLNYIKNSEIKLIDKTENKDYEIKNYNYLKHMINVHSWLFGSSRNESFVSLTSTNELDDLSLNFTYTGNAETQSDSYLILGEYTKYWPKLKFLYNKVLEEKSAFGDYDKTSIKIDLPFYLSKDGFKREFNIGTAYSNIKKSNDYYNILELSVSFVNGKYLNKRDMKSEDLQNIELKYSVDLNDTSTNTISLESSFENKALSENDSFSYSLSIMQNKGNLILADDSIVSRGYSNSIYDFAIKNSFDYSFPLLYPDKGGKGLFLQRVSANVFYDSALAKMNNVKNTYDSVGVDFNLNLTLLSLIPIVLKTEYTYLLDEKSNVLTLGFEL